MKKENPFLDITTSNEPLIDYHFAPRQKKEELKFNTMVLNSFPPGDTPEETLAKIEHIEETMNNDCIIFLRLKNNKQVVAFQYEDVFDYHDNIKIITMNKLGEYACEVQEKSMKYSDFVENNITGILRYYKHRQIRIEYDNGAWSVIDLNKSKDWKADLRGYVRYVKSLSGGNPIWVTLK